MSQVDKLPSQRHTCSLIFLSFVFPHWNRWSFGIEVFLLVTLHQRADKINATNSPDPSPKSALNRSRLYSCFISIHFSPIVSYAFFGPTEMNVVLESKSSCSATLHQTATEVHFVAQTNTSNAHVHPSRAALGFFFFFFLHCGAITFTFSCSCIHKHRRIPVWRSDRRNIRTVFRKKVRNASCTVTSRNVLV